MYLSILKVLKDLCIEHHLFGLASELAVEDLTNQEKFTAFSEAKFPSTTKPLVRHKPVTEPVAPDSPPLRIQGLDLEVPYKDAEVIEGIIRQKEQYEPDLEVLFVDCNTHVPTLPNELYKLAEDHGVILGVL